MRIELMQISVRDLVEGYQENDCEGGVKGYGGRLDIRPPFQREFVYGPAQRDAVIATLIKGYPLNVMYWSVRGDGTFEVIDGQQRTISIARYVAKKSFSVLGADGKPCYFHSLHEDERERMLDYQLTVYLCEGSDSERLAWFRTINIAGVKLYEQELRNAVYAGPWVSDAKRRFSKSGCVAYKMASSYLSGSPIRQDYLETAINSLLKIDLSGAVSQAAKKSSFGQFIRKWELSIGTPKHSIFQALASLSQANSRPSSALSHLSVTMPLRPSRSSA